LGDFIHYGTGFSCLYRDIFRPFRRTFLTVK
jgi:hypothetical protein